MIDESEICDFVDDEPLEAVVKDRELRHISRDYSLAIKLGAYGLQPQCRLWYCIVV